MEIKQSVADRLRVARERILMEELAIKNWERRKDDIFRDSEIEKQERVIIECLGKIAKINSDYCVASDKISELLASIKYEEKKIYMLERKAQIEKILKLREKIRELGGEA